MKFLLPIATLLIISFCANAQLIDWHITQGGPGDDATYASILQEDEYLISAGIYSNTVDFDPGNDTLWFTSAGQTDGFIQKLDTNGNIIWAKSIGGPGIDFIYYIAADDSGNVYAVGQFEGTVDFDPGVQAFNLTATSPQDAFLLKLDSTGQFQWVRHIGSTAFAKLYGVSVKHNQVYATGFFEDTISFFPSLPDSMARYCAGRFDYIIARYTPGGRLVWGETLGGIHGDIGYHVFQDDSGFVYISGEFAGEVDFDPGADTFMLSTSGGVTDAGGFLQKLDSNGNFIHVKKWNTDNSYDGCALSLIDSDGDQYVSGWYVEPIDLDPGAGTLMVPGTHQIDAFLTKTSANAPSVDWGLTVGGDFWQFISDISVDDESNVYIIGESGGNTMVATSSESVNIPSMGAQDVFAVKLDSNGVLDWVYTIGGVSEDRGSSIEVSTSGYVYMAGRLSAAIDVNPNGDSLIAQSAGGIDSYLSKLKNETIIDHIDENNPKLAHIYPNPASDELHIALNRTYEKARVLICSTTGSIMLDREYTTIDHIRVKPSFPAGVYFITVQLNTTSFTQRVLLK